jgi:Domain of unknown function (DUF5666)
MPNTGSDQNPSRRTIDLVRIGVVLGACLALALSAVVVLGASPAPTGPGADSKASAVPGQADHRSGLLGGWLGLRDFFGGGRGQGLAGPRGGFGATVGRSITIDSIDGSKIGLKTDDGWTRTITVGSDAKIDKDGKSATVADLKVGDRVILRQKRNDDGTYSVTGLSAYLPVVAGTVSAIDGNEVTVKARGGSTRTVTLTGSTAFKVGPTDGKKADLKVDSVVIVSGTEGPGDAFTASTVRIQVRLDRVGGEVLSKTKDSITVKQRDGSKATIQIAADTKFFVRGATTPGLDDVDVGMRLSAVGTKNADGSFEAAWVAAGKPRTDAKPKPAASPNGSGTPG